MNVRPKASQSMGRNSGGNLAGGASGISGLTGATGADGAATGRLTFGDFGFSEAISGQSRVCVQHVKRSGRRTDRAVVCPTQNRRSPCVDGCAGQGEGRGVIAEGRKRAGKVLRRAELE